MSGKYKKLISIPIVIIAIGLYLIGVNLLNRVDRVDDIKEAVPASYETETQAATKTEEQEDKELGAIDDKININTATKSELMLLDGIGEVLAERIINRREQVGEFTNIDQLLEIENLGEKKFEDIRDYVTIENAQKE